MLRLSMIRTNYCLLFLALHNAIDITRAEVTVIFDDINHKLVIANSTNGPPTQEFYRNLTESIDVLFDLTITNCSTQESDDLNWICQYTMLNRLSLSHNILVTIPDCFRKLTNLTHLDLSSNRLYRIPSEIGYEIYLRHLDLSENHITDLLTDSWLNITSLSYLEAFRLNMNTIQHLPPAVKTWNETGRFVMDISDNYFACTCDEIWLKPWVIRHRNYLSNYERIYCMNIATKVRKPLIDTPSHEFICAPYSDSKFDHTITELIIVFICTILFLPTIIVSIFYAVRYNRLAIFRKTHWHPFDEDNCENEAMQQDVFLVYTASQQDWAERKIESYLVERDFKVVPIKDIDDVKTSTELLQTTIQQSKRVVCVMSRDFIYNSTCMQIIQLSMERDCRKRRPRSILVLADEMRLAEVVSQTHPWYKDSVTLYADSRTFHSDLLYWLPTTTLAGKTRDYEVFTHDTIQLQEVENEWSQNVEK